MQTHDVLFDSQNKKWDENFEMKQKKPTNVNSS
jgi:hypothetical protein